MTITAPKTKAAAMWMIPMRATKKIPSSTTTTVTTSYQIGLKKQKINRMSVALNEL